MIHNFSACSMIEAPLILIDFFVQRSIFFKTVSRSSTSRSCFKCSTSPPYYLGQNFGDLLHTESPVKGQGMLVEVIVR